MTRAGGAFLPGQKSKYHKNGKRKKKYKPVSYWDDHDVDPVMGAEHTTSARVNGSRYWQPKVDERDDFGQVTVYDGAGNVVRTIPKEALTRPWLRREGARWSEGKG